ncbi:hypothetical protein DERF_005070 [Dermatophagoides farinae]|uniref:Uncharacterized protein n=1 Tax=Dermatophagoides farinae TaxID=6954 RepID=A0A922L674_DERFA|nr:hypothetical protein DERF_005070 [Dermatophagoides farinae]
MVYNFIPSIIFLHIFSIRRTTERADELISSNFLIFSGRISLTAAKIHFLIYSPSITQMTQISMTRNESNNGNDALKIVGNKPGWLIMTNSMTRMTNGYQHYDQQ